MSSRISVSHMPLFSKSDLSSRSDKKSEARRLATGTARKMKNRSGSAPLTFATPHFLIGIFPCIHSTRIYSVFSPSVNQVFAGRFPAGRCSPQAPLSSHAKTRQSRNLSQQLSMQDGRQRITFVIRDVPLREDKIRDRLCRKTPAAAPSLIKGAALCRS
jgi:hypothetical protein